MPLIDSRGRVFGLLNLFDAAIAAAVLVGVVGVVVVKSGHNAIARLIEKTGTAEVDLMVRCNIENPQEKFRVGDKAFVTIRNVPYDKVAIAKVDVHRVRISVPIDNGRSLRVTNDPANPFATEVLLTLRSPAEETADGITWGSQKLKVGVPIDIEGKKYRLRGSVLDVRMDDKL